MVTNKDLNDVVCGIIALSGYFTQKAFFIEKLWKKDKKCKNMSDGDVMAYFMAMAAREKGIYVRPIGASWAAPCSKEDSDEYVTMMEPLANCYMRWANAQR